MKPPQDSRVTPVVSALKTICETINGLQVVVGSYGGRNIGKDVLSLAVGRDSVTIQRSKMRGATIVYLEEMKVKYRLVCWSGTSDAEVRIARVEEIQNALRVALAADPRLGGVVDIAMLGTDDGWDIWSDTSGASAVVNSSVLTRATV